MTEFGLVGNIIRITQEKQRDGSFTVTVYYKGDPDPMVIEGLPKDEVINLSKGTLGSI